MVRRRGKVYVKRIAAWILTVALVATSVDFSALQVQAAGENGVETSTASMDSVGSTDAEEESAEEAIMLLAAEEAEGDDVAGQTIDGITVTRQGDTGTVTYTEGTGFSFTGGGSYTLSGTWTGSMQQGASNTNQNAVINLSAGDDYNITMSDLVISVDQDYVSPFRIADNSMGDVTITLADGTENVLKSGYDAAGLQKNGGENTGKLTIGGAGKLTVTGGHDSAGIGGGPRQSGSNIEITGGTIAANSTQGGAGIGGGFTATGNNITITGGIVTASVDYCYHMNGCYYYAAGIGGGNDTSNNITISANASVKATGQYTTDIGCTPKDENGKEVYLMQIANPDKEAITIRGKEFPYRQHSEDDTTVYAYVPAAEDSSDVIVTVGEKQYAGRLQEDGSSKVWELIESITVSEPGLTVVKTDGENGTIDYTAENGYTLTGGGSYTISGTWTDTSCFQEGTRENSNAVITLSAGNDYEITLNNVTIDASETKYIAAFRIADGSTGNVTIILPDGTKNVLKGGNSAAGLQKNGGVETGTLTIQGTGQLTATSAYDAAGIGGSYKQPSSNIKITDGTIITNSEWGGAGIGAGVYADGSNITITGGNVTATVTDTCFAVSGIGGAGGGKSSNIRIYANATVKAQGLNAADIGCTPTDENGKEVYLMKIENKNKEKIVINGNEFPYQVHSDEDSAVYAYVADIDDNQEATVLVGTTQTIYRLVGDGSQKAWGAYDSDTKKLERDGLKIEKTAGDNGNIHYLSTRGFQLTGGGSYTISGTWTGSSCLQQGTQSDSNAIITLSADDDYEITLNNVTIDASDTPCIAAFRIADGSSGNVTITLPEGTKNVLKGGKNAAGLQKNGGVETGTLTIQGTGELTATSAYDAAGIGGSYNQPSSNIMITGGTIIANSEWGGAGIGAGVRADGSNITITGGNVTATVTATAYAVSGIGGGGGGKSSNISIYSNATVKAQGLKTSDIGCTPTDEEGNPVYLMKIENENKEKIVINGKEFPYQVHSDEDSAVYAYVADINDNQEATVLVGTTQTIYRLAGGGSQKVWGASVSDTMKLERDGLTIEKTAGDNGNIHYVSMCGFQLTGGGSYTISGSWNGIDSIKEGSSASNAVITLADDSSDYEITLNGVSIDTSSKDYVAAFRVADNSTGTVTVNLAAGTENVLKSGYRAAGLQKNGTEGNLVITGTTGQLTAAGGMEAPGIGVGTAADGSTVSGTVVTIDGGVINATGGTEASGIGSSYWNSGSNNTIAINGGTVTATGRGEAAAIGGVRWGSGSNHITISGGRVTALQSYGYYETYEEEENTAVEIGTIGSAYSSDKVVITGGTVKASFNITPVDEQERPVYLMKIDNPDAKDITINGSKFPYQTHSADDTAVYVYVSEADNTDYALVTVGDIEYAGVLTGDGSSKTWKLTQISETRDGLTIRKIGDDVLNQSGAIKFTESNGFEISGGGSYAISGTWTGSVDANTTGGDWGQIATNAVITLSAGKDYEILFNGLNIDASKLAYVAAFRIADNSTGNVTITLADGTENVLKSGTRAAALQKNNDTNVDVGKLTITGTGKLTAAASYDAAGIGGGYYWNGSNITILGGNITATSNWNGDGIGGGYNSSANNNLVVAGTASVKAASNGRSAFGSTPTDESDNTLYLMKIENPDGEAITIDGEAFPHRIADAEDKAVYAYRADKYANQQMTVKIGETEYLYQLMTEGSQTMWIQTRIVDETDKEFTVDGLTITKTGGDGHVEYWADRGFHIFGGGKYTISGEWTGAMTAGTSSNLKAVITISDSEEYNITLKGLTIDVSAVDYAAAFSIADDSTGTDNPGKVTVTLAENTDNVLKSGAHTAGLQVNSDSVGTLTIAGTGSLSAVGGSGGAGIGSAEGKTGNAISIQGGRITATAQSNNNGINGTTISISLNASVKAQGANNKAGLAVTPTDEAGNEVYLMKIENPDNVSVSINNAPYSYQVHSTEETYAYAWVPDNEGKQRAEVTVGEVEYTGKLIEENGTKVWTLSQISTEKVQAAGLTVTKTAGDNGVIEFTAAKIYELTGGGSYTISGTWDGSAASGSDNSRKAVITIADNENYHITFEDLTIDASAQSYLAAFSVPEDSDGEVSIILADGTDNVLKGGCDAAGIEKNGTSGKLILQGTGQLTAVGRGWGVAGIGSDDEEKGTNVEIQSGTILATGGYYAAGIGSSRWGGESNTITITGGIITASSDSREDEFGMGHESSSIPGIGGSSSDNIVITGGSVKSSFSATPRNEEGGAVYLMKIANTDSAEIQIEGETFPYRVHSENDLAVYAFMADENGDQQAAVTVGDEKRLYKLIGSNNRKWVESLTSDTEITRDGLTVTKTAGEEGSIEYLADNGFQLTGGGSYTISGIWTGTIADAVSSEHKAVISLTDDAEYQITLSGAEIDISATPYVAAFRIADDSTKDVTVILAEGTDNVLKSGYGEAGLKKKGDTGKLTISGLGALSAAGSGNGAGIGGGSSESAGNITISGGAVTAVGGNNAAGIGAGYNATTTEIVIAGAASVKASNQNKANAIGCTPVDEEDREVYLMTIVNAENAELSINGTAFPYKAHSEEEQTVYAYVADEKENGKAAVDFGGTEEAYTLVENNSQKSWVASVSSDTEITRDGLTITRTAGEGGNIEYLADNGFRLTGGGSYTINGAWDGSITAGTSAKHQAVITVSDDAEYQITLNGLTIDTSTVDYVAAFRIADDSNANVTITLAEGTDNVLKSGKEAAGLEKNGSSESGSLTISGLGTLSAAGGSNGAGIGGGYNGSGSNITISGGVITAAGGSNSTGIGAGYKGSSANIILTAQASVKASGQGSAGAIGCTPKDEAGREVYLMKIDNPDGAEIALKGGNFPYQAHSAENQSVYVYVADADENQQTTITRGGAEVDYILLEQNSQKQWTEAVIAENEITRDGLTIQKTDGGSGSIAYVSGSGFRLMGGGSYTISGKWTGTLTAGTTANHQGVITVADGADYQITFNGLNINTSSTDCAAAFRVADGSTGDVTITLAAGTKNVLTSGARAAGIEKNDTKGSLTIDGSGSLTATGGRYAAGIGGGSSAVATAVTISGGNITAAGGTSGAGIGTGGGDNWSESASGSIITITGGTVTATGGDYAAGIGSSEGMMMGSSGTDKITISGGTVNATGGRYAAGIGGSVWGGSGSDITISGGAVTATGGTNAKGIGTSGEEHYGGSSTVVITGGSVNSTFGVDPKDAENNTLILLTIDNSENEEVAINGTTYPTVYDGSGTTSANSGKIYAYLPASETSYLVSIGEEIYEYSYDSENGTWQQPDEPMIRLSIEAPELAEALVYTGSAQALIANAGSAKQEDDSTTLTVKYRLEGSEDSTENAADIQASDVGDYIVYYQVWKGETALTGERELAVSIARTDSTITLSAVQSGTKALRKLELSAVPAGINNETLTGTVSFYEITEDAEVLLDTVRLSEGQASYTWENLSQQEYQVKAVYNGSTNYKESESDLQTVDTSRKSVTGLAVDTISAKTYGDAAFTLSLSCKELGAITQDVTFESSDSSIVSITGSTATIKQARSVVITANWEGDDIYNEASAQVSLNIAKATPAITLSTVQSGSKADRRIALNAALEGVNGETLTGSVSFYEIADSGKATLIQTVDLSDNEASYTWEKLSQKEYQLKAVYNGSSDYREAETDIQTVDTSRKSVTGLAFDTISAKTYGDAAFTLSLSCKELGAITKDVTFESSDSSIVSITGSTATIKQAGNVVLTASWEGDDTYNEASAQVSLSIDKRKLTVTAEDKLNIANGSAMPAFTYTVQGLADGDTYTAPEMTTTAQDTATAGEYPIVITGGTLTNADSYQVSYVNGKLVIQEPTAEPGEPTDPSTPGEPTDPSTPSEPTDPADPSTPSEPTDPGSTDTEVKDGFQVVFAELTASYGYTGSAITPEVVVLNNGITLTEGEDYTVKYAANVNVGTAAVIITGMGNYTGKQTLTFEITKQDIGDAEAVMAAETLIVAAGQKPRITLMFNGASVSAKEYAAVYTDEQGNVIKNGKFTTNGTITLTAKEKNFTGTRTIDVEIADKSEMKKLSVNFMIPKTGVTYTGTPYILSDDEYEVKTAGAADGDTPVESEDGIYGDYIVSYANNTNVGTAKVTFTGIGYYTGSVITKTFKIMPATTGINDESDLADSYNYSPAGAITIGKDLHFTFGAGADIQTLAENRDYKVKYTGNKQPGTAKYTVTFAGNYKGHAPISGTFTIGTPAIDDQTVEAVSADVIYKNNKAGVYTSVPTVTMDGATIKSSDYTVSYYLEESMTEESRMSKTNPVELEEGDDYATVYVKIVSKGKNFAEADEDTYATCSYRVWSPTAVTDLSKAKITITGATKNKVSYTGKACEPTITVEVKKGNAYELVDASQYEVIYINNISVGKAKVMIKAVEGSGYGGSKTAAFTITKKDIQTK